MSLFLLYDFLASFKQPRQTDELQRSCLADGWTEKMKRQT